MNKFLISLVILFTIPLNGFGVDIYTPSLPILSKYFNTSKELLQISIGIYLLGFGVIQFFIGVICDSIGRRKLYLYSIFVYVLVTLLITQAATINVLLILRFSQGVTIGIVMVAGRAIINDLFVGKELQKISGSVSLTWAIGPIVAPMIGGYLQHYINWQANFDFLAIYGFISFILFYFFVPETLSVKTKFNFNYAKNSYKTVFSNLEFMLCTFMVGFIYSILVLYNVVSPFLIQNVLHFSVISFGYVAFLMGIMWFLGSLLNKFLHNISRVKKAKYAFTILLLISTIMTIISIFCTNIYTIIIPISLIFLSASFLFSTYYSHNMAIVPRHIAATAGSCMGSVVVIIASVGGSFFGSLLKASTAIPLSLGILGVVVLCCIIYFIDNKLFNAKKQVI